MTTSALFTPLNIGPLTLKHRVVMAPLTRSRSEQPGDIPGDLMREYYTQRASDGGFIISEATTISATARGWFGAPGIYTDQQVEGWKKIVDSVHAKGGRMFSQLWHTGRSSHLEVTGGRAGLGNCQSVVLAGCFDASLPRRTVGSRPPHIAPWKFLRFTVSSRTIAKLQSTPRLPALMVSNFIRPTAICRISSFKMEATSAPTPMVVPLQTGRALCSRSCRH